uniref:Uncharacterized protein LOC102802074 n=1 Tax=Saccoglossus kowalevskii TaxID=10224 RepID=A0ABM0MR95_SACKO
MSSSVSSNNPNCHKATHKTRRKANKSKSLASKLRLGYVNFRGLKSKEHELSPLLRELNLDIFGGTETFLKNSKTPVVKGYKWFGKNRKLKLKKGGGGIGFLVKNNFQVIDDNLFQSQDDDIERLWIKLKVGEGQTLSLCVVYVPPENTNKDGVDELYHELFSNISNLEGSNDQYLLLGDFNGRIGNISGKKITSSTGSAKPWFDQEIKSAINERKKSNKKHREWVKENSSYHDNEGKILWNKYLEDKNNVQNLIKQKKIENKVKQCIEVGKCGVIGKIYSKIVEKELTDLVESNNILGEIQGGFRKNRRTIDQVFILKGIASIRKHQKKHTYFAFLDFKKAYDSIWREGLWYALWQNGVKGKLWRIIKNTYNHIESKVSFGDIETDYFTQNEGLKQGCVLAPTLFSIYMNELKKLLDDSLLGVKLDEICINGLFFADDVVLIAPNEVQLKSMLNVTNHFCKLWKMTINEEKSNVLIINKKVNKNKDWQIGNSKIKEASEYKYLGYWIT